MREVRFAAVQEAVQPHAPTNAWAGTPATDALVPRAVLRAVVSGPVDPTTGYLLNITLIDQVLRGWVIPRLVQRITDTAGPAGLARAMPDLWNTAADHLAGARLESLELWPSPYLHYGIEAGDSSMITLTQTFEFAAAHRLYVPDWSLEDNRRVFGKCTNPNGHGHNYLLEVTVAGEPDPVSGALVELPFFERTVRERVIARFDHQHLNADCPEFARLNPSVENITRVIWGLLQDAFPSCRLHAIRVWETPKTYAEYRGEA